MSGSSNRFTGKWIGQRYCIEQELGRGGMGAVYRAFHVDDPSNDVAIKLIHRNQKMSSMDFLRFQKEAALMSQLYHSNIIAFHELGILQAEESKEFSGGYYIVMDYARGKNLKESLNNDGRKDLAFLFQVGLQVADALDYTHGKNIIHRDIKPQNIIVSQASGDERGVHVRVLDFGVARLGNMIGREDGSTEDRAGTPLYMAPEQTASGFGVPDHRVDLYSLGCVLYEILTGRPPFSGENRQALERAHQTSLPEDIQNLRPDVPVVVAQIIHKLLEKRPDDRYQTAFSLSADLLRAKALWEQKPRHVPSFPLALKDHFYAVSAQLPIQGRDSETEAIFNEYRQVSGAKARGRVTVLTGGAGMGKTRVLNEIQSRLASQRIKFLSGVFTQHENALPFNALANAFNELLVKIVKTSPVDADLLSRRVRQVIGPEAHLVASVVPGLRPFLSDIPEPEDGVDIEGDRYARFAKAFSDFTKCLVPETQPLVMILDDVHWADERSLVLIEQFFSNANSLRFHLVVSCRLDVAAPDSAFARFIAKFRGLKVRYAEVALSPLSLQSAAGVVGALLRQPDMDTGDLVAYLFAQSGGVPMRLVELTRRLVALDLIRTSRVERRWEWNVAEIQGARVSLNAVDLVLGRLVEFSGADLAVLRAAATCGMSFQYETLLLGGRNAPASVIRLIERAVDEGIVVRCPEPADTKHLGKAYIFIHKKVRDAIYNVIEPELRRDLHRDIARQLIASISNPKDQMLFALAQHLNRSLSGRTDPELEALALRYNLDAGDSIRAKQGWTAADNYYEIALDIIDSGRVSSMDKKLRRLVIERLADVSAGQTNFKAALQRFAELLKMPMSRQEYAAAAGKASQIHLVCGNISESQSLISKGLAAVGQAIPVANFARQARFYLNIFWDMATISWSGGPMVVGLRRCWDHWKRHGDSSEIYFAPAKLKYLASIIGGRHNNDVALAAHDAARRDVVAGRAPISIAVKVVADRAALLADWGRASASYRLFDMAERLARHTAYSRSSGYVSLSRAMSIDYIKGRMEDVAIHLREASEKIDPEQDRLAYATLLVFRQYLEMTHCRFEAQETLNAEVRETIPTRNWLSSVSMAVWMFGLLLQGKRQRLVKVGEEYTRRRRAVGAREDLFSSLVMTMLVFARGEDDQTRIHFSKVTNGWMSKGNRESFMAWQDDFIGMFLLTLPVLFEIEYGRQLMRNAEMFAWLSRLRERDAWWKLIRPERTIQDLVVARTNELVGSSKVKALYDKTIKNANADGFVVAQILSYLWFGSYLVRAGHNKRGDYLQIAMRKTREHDVPGLEELAQRVMEKLKIPVPSSGDQSKAGLGSESVIQVGADMVASNLDYIVSCLNQELDVTQDLRGCVDILKRLYVDAQVSIFLTDAVKSGSVLYHFDEMVAPTVLLESVSPYFTIRSTLMLHVSPTAVVSRQVDMGQKTEEPLDLGETLKPPGDQELEATRVQGTASRDDSRVNAGHDGAAASQALDSGGRRDAGQDKVLTLIPVRAGAETVGLIVIGNLDSQALAETQKVKRDLDVFGAQLGLLLTLKFQPLASYLSASNRGVPTDLSLMGGDYFESVDWLDIQLRGKLRKEREASWYLGLRWGDAQYLVVYCCIKGDVMDRDRLSAQLLYQMFVIRELMVMLGQNRSEVVDLRLYLQKLLNSFSLAGRMDEVMLAYSLFDKTSELVSSGHYGPSRPVVLGVENRVTAFNEATLRLRDGRDLRYWEVYAQMGESQVYLVSYDTSRIDGSGPAYLNIASQFSQSQAGSKSATKMLQTAVEHKVLPRYYLVVTRRPK